MSNEHENHEAEKPVEEPATTQEEKPAAEGEFKLTVRKLEMPVRPRGVLAE